MSATDTNQGGGSSAPDGPFVPAHDGAPLAEAPAEEQTEAVEAVEAVGLPADDVVQSSPLRILAVFAALAAIWVLASPVWVFVILAIVLMLFLHELGHYLTARRAGMLVTEFFIGFGPRIWSFRRGEVEYGLKAIPAGAYVRIVGMSNLDEVDPADEARTYRQQPFWQRFSVAVAGSTMHFLLAFVLLFTLFVGFGEPDRSAWTIDRITPSEGLQQNGEPVPSPAVEAGLRSGDRIVAVDDVVIDEFTDLKDAIETRPGDTVTLTVERDGETFEATTTLLTQGPDGAEEGFLGVSGDVPLRRLGPLAAVQRSGSTFGTVVAGSLGSIPKGVSNLFQAAADSTSTDDQSTQVTDSDPSSDPNQNRIVSIYGAARLGEQAVRLGMATVLILFAMVNIFIGIFNLLPLLPLDGGHVAIAVYEKVREWRLGNRRRYFADVGKLLPLTYAVVMVMVGIGVLTLYMDVINPIDLPN